MIVQCNYTCIGNMQIIDQSKFFFVLNTSDLVKEKTVLLYLNRYTIELLQYQPLLYLLLGEVRELRRVARGVECPEELSLSESEIESLDDSDINVSELSVSDDASSECRPRKTRFFRFGRPDT